MNDARYHTPTVILVDGSVAFIQDFVEVIHPTHGRVMGKIWKLNQKV